MRTALNRVGGEDTSFRRIIVPDAGIMIDQKGYLIGSIRRHFNQWDPEHANNVRTCVMGRNYEAQGFWKLLGPMP